ncbi:MAG TPA: tetratricopeptide repeat protein, partial [Nitrososphaera sp.]|nr:tetratricopeptide repeat protein [Nitrososphaera sp.]
PQQLSNLSAAERCGLAADFIYSGQYETAQEVLGDLWRGVGVRPEVDEYEPEIAAEILLQCGCLSRLLGSSRSVKDAQERAKDLLTEALRIFQSLNNREKASETQYELGMCYWRIGAFEEARLVLNKASDETESTEQKCKIRLRQTLVETATGKPYEALNLLNQINIDNASDALKGRWHGQMASVLRRLSNDRLDYADKAIIEFTAAIYHYEQAGHERYCGNNLNNLALLLYKLGRYEEAHECLNRAYEIFKKLKDAGSMGQVEETRTRVLIAEERYEEARLSIISAIAILEEEKALLTDALTLKAIVYARLNDPERSIPIFRQAIEIGESFGALSYAGNAALSMIEEHYDNISEIELCEQYRRADRLLGHTQDSEAIERLRSCARILIKRLGGAQLTENFTLPEVVREYEARFIKEALEAEKGVLTKAALRLGVSRQVLAHILNTRHKSLLHKRTPVLTRYKGIIKR